MAVTLKREPQPQSLRGVAPSYRYNNLVESNGLLAYARGKECIVAALGSGGGLHKLPIGESEKHLVLCCSFATLIDVSRSPSDATGDAIATVLAVTTQMWTQLWGVPAAALRYSESHPFDPSAVVLLVSLSHSPASAAGNTNAVVRQPGNTTVVVMVGCEHGFVSLAALDVEKKTADYLAHVKAHEECTVSVASAAVDAAYLAAAPCLFASADNGGTLCLWDAQHQPYVRIPAVDATECVTSVAVVGALFVAAAYGSGKIRLFAQKDGLTRMEVCAHSRWIDAMAYHSGANVLCTVGQDGLLNVWGIPGDESSHSVAHLATATTSEFLSTGLVAFGEISGMCPWDAPGAASPPWLPPIKLVGYDNDFLLTLTA